MRKVCLGEWEEAVGVLRGVDEEGLAFDGFRVVPPGFQPEALRGLVGRWVGVLRTDRDYRVREVR